MAQLKWDQVAAPNLSGGITGIETANRMFGGGLGNMATALSQFGDRQALEQLSRYSDAQKLQQDLQAGTFNTGNASAEALKTIMGRPSDLIRNAYTQQAIDHSAVMNPLNQQYRQLEIDDKQVMDPLNQEAKRQSNAHDAVMNPLKESDKRLSNLQNKLNHDRSEEQRALGLAMGQQWAAYTRDNLMTPDAAYAFVEQYKDNPVAYRMATDLVAKNVPGFNQPIISPSLGSIPGAGGTVPVAGGAVDAGRLFESLLQTESNGQQFNKDGSVVTSPKGATGIAQVMPATGPEAAKLAGLPWDAEKFKKDPEYNKALGKAYFNKQLQSFGNDPAKALAAYNAGPGATQKAIAQASAEGKPDAWLNYLPKETQDYVPKTLGRLNGQQPTALTPGQQATAISNKVAQDNTTSRQLLQAANMFSDTGLMNAAAAAYEKDPKGLEKAQAVASRLTGENGSMRGIDVNDTRSAIEDVMTELGVSAAVAGTFVESAIKSGFLSDLGGLGIFDTQKVDKGKLGKLLDTIGGKRDKDGKYENRNKVNAALNALVKNTASENANNKLATSEKEIAEIAAYIKQLEGMGSSPAVQQGIAAANARLAVALANQQQALEGTNSAVLGRVGDLTPPAPPPPAPVATQPAAPVGTVSSGSGNSNAVRGLDYSASANYWRDRAQQHAKKREEQSNAEAARKAKEAKEEMDRRRAAAQRMKEMFPETSFLAY